MKNKILSLIVLAAILANSVFALAGTTKGPYDPCTAVELRDGTCVKQLYPMSNYVAPVQLAANEKLNVSIKGGQDCYQRMDVDWPDQRRQRLYNGQQFDLSGRYMFSNQTMDVCELTLLVK